MELRTERPGKIVRRRFEPPRDAEQKLAKAFELLTSIRGHRNDVCSTVQEPASQAPTLPQLQEAIA